MRYEVVIVFRYKCEGERYYSPHIKKFVIDAISKLNEIIENKKKFYTIISLDVKLVEEDNE